MDPRRRIQYLRALDIDVWLPRTAAREPALPQPAAGARTAAAVQAAPASRALDTPAAGASGMDAPAAAAGSSDSQAALWQALRAEVETCTRCDLCKGRTQTVFGVGDVRAEWMVVGEAPGAEEDRRGEPFVGRAGQLLNAMLRAIGLERESVYIANILKCRPPNNRDPRPQEVASCLPYLRRQIALIQPKLILAVGRIAAQNLLDTTAPLGRLRGQVHSFGELNTPLVVTYHPSYLLRVPADKRKAWEDLKFARDLHRQLTSAG